MKHNYTVTAFVAELPADIQVIILSRLIQSGLSPIAIGDAMNSRLADLSDTIDITDLI